MSEDNTKVSREGYLTELRQRLERDVAEIIENGDSYDEFINFIVDEIYASYKRGVEAGRRPRKKAYRNGKPRKASPSR